MGGRSRRFIYVIVFAATAILAAVAGWILARQSMGLSRDAAAVAGPIAVAGSRQQVHLYFGDGLGQYLSAQSRIMDQPVDAAVAARQLVDALIQGPEREGTPTVPQEAILRNIFVTGEGIAYVDFSVDAFARHPGGVETELLTIYSIVNTLVLNVEQIRCVKFLVGGQEAATLAGHVDLSRPFKADMLWVR